MCGIAGITNLRDGLEAPGLDQLSRMIGAVEHRGPDELGVYRDASTGLAHARLSIIDLGTGQQPLSNEDGTLWVVFNGEIFNYVELRGELEALGHVFRTQSDTETLVHAWESWGEGTFERLNGQWAAALWDARERRLVLTRDRLGVRPLYYVEHGGRLVFGSEVKALFAGEPGLSRRLDPLGLEETFTFWTVVPPQTLFQGIRELEPGHFRSYAPGRPVRDQAYWTPSYPGGGKPAFHGSLGEAAEALSAALEQAIRLRMLRADVPVGCYLSGGLDSSLVAALAKRATPNGFETFSLRFADAEYDETPYQRAMVARLGTRHSEVLVTRQDIAEILPAVVRHTERPILRTAPAPLFLLSRLVRKRGIKVVLTGEGADEMLAGYDLFREAKVRRFWARCPNSDWRPRLLERLYPYLASSVVAQLGFSRRFFGRGLDSAGEPGFAHGPRWACTGSLKRIFSPAQREAVGSIDVVARLLDDLPAQFTSWQPLAQDQYLEIRTLLSGYLLSSQGDRMLMANSIEGRFPFLDKDVVELANSLPPRFQLSVLDEKHVLKRVARGLVADRVIKRPKQPYRSPDAQSLVGGDRPAWTDEVMSEDALRDAGVFDVKVARRVWDKGRHRRVDSPFSNTDNMAIVGLLTTQLLHQEFIRTPPRRQKAAVELKTLVDRLGGQAR